MNRWILLFFCPLLHCFMISKSTFSFSATIVEFCLCLYFLLFWCVILSMLALDFYCLFSFLEWVMELFCPWFHPLFTWCLGQSVHSENLIRNLQQSWLILTLSCQRTNLYFMACTFYNAKWVSILRVFLPSFSLSSLQLDYLNLDPPVLQWPAASISFAPNLCILLTFWERNIPFYCLIIIYYCDIVIGLKLWKCFKGDIWEMDVVLEVPFSPVLKLCQFDHLSI